MQKKVGGRASIITERPVTSVHRYYAIIRHTQMFACICFTLYRSVASHHIYLCRFSQVSNMSYLTKMNICAIMKHMVTYLYLEYTSEPSYSVDYTDTHWINLALFAVWGVWCQLVPQGCVQSCISPHWGRPLDLQMQLEVKVCRRLAKLLHWLQATAQTDRSLLKAHCQEYK